MVKKLKKRGISEGLKITLIILAILAVLISIIYVLLPGGDLANLGEQEEPDLPYEEKYDLCIKSKMYYSCAAIVQNDVSLCDARRNWVSPIDPSVQSLKGRCEDDYFLYQGLKNPSLCNNITVANKKIICDIAGNQYSAPCDSLSEDLAPLCNAISQKDKSQCSSSSSEGERIECENVYVQIIEMGTGSDVTICDGMQNPMIAEGEVRNQTIVERNIQDFCRALVTGDISHCEKIDAGSCEFEAGHAYNEYKPE